MDSEKDFIFSKIERVQNFPKPGIEFYDLMPLLYQGHLGVLTELLAKCIKPDDFDTVVAVEARGFIFGTALAQKLSKNLVVVRKPGKLAPPTLKISYDLEYGKDTLEMHKGSGRVLIVDDILATGGTLKAAADLCTDAGYEVTGFLTVVNLSKLNQFIWNNLSVTALYTV